MTHTQPHTQPHPLLCFTNPGEIDPRLIHVLGTNVKSNTSAIGQFGTGLKYAIAGVLRLRGELTILTGTTRITFHTQLGTIRGKTFTFIVMETTHPGSSPKTQELGFTTDLGLHWEPWMLYRELYCNALDEGGSVFTADTTPQGQDHHTTIIVNCPELRAVHNMAGKWILDSHLQPLAATPELELYPYRDDNSYFYRGIKVGELAPPPLFTYNVLTKADLTEDRTMSEYTFNSRLASVIFKSQDLSEETLTQIIRGAADPVHFESHLYWPGSWETPSPTLLAILTKNMKTKTFPMPAALLRACVAHLPHETPVSLTLPLVQTRMLAKARTFLSTIGITITAPVVIVETLGTDTIHGLAESGTIYLPLDLFERGTKYVASTLLEEHIHIKHGYADCTRELQTWLFDKIISLGEIIRGEPI